MIQEVVAALDIGGTKIAAGLVDRDGRVLRRAQAPTPATAGPEAILATAAALVASLQELEPAVQVVALGVGSAGVIDPASGTVLGATDALSGWAGTDVRTALAEAVGVPAVVRNDVHVHALGEATRGAGTGRSVLFVAVGTGVGGAYVHPDLPGHVLAGAHAAAGHIGHVPSPHAAGLPCSCGGTGHLEAIAAGPALVREMGRRTGRSFDDLRQVARCAEDGDPDARAVVDLGGRAVGAAVGGLVNVLDPDVVVIGGGVAGLGPRWWEPLVASVAEETVPALAGIQVLPTSLGGDAALHGAAHLASEMENR